MHLHFLTSESFSTSANLAADRNRFSSGMQGRRSRGFWIGYAVPCVVVWSIYLLAYWPGLMSSDSIDQWGQMLSGHVNDAHPAFHTITNWLITRIWMSPAAVALVQILALALVFALAMREFESWGVPRWVRWLLTGLFSLMPINGLMSISLWKDIPYTIAMLGMFVILLRLVRTSGAWLKSRSGFLLTALSLFAISIYRHNGLVVAVLLTAALAGWLWRTRFRGRIILLGLSWMALWTVITIPVYQMLGVTPLSPYFADQNLVHQVGAFLNSGAMLTESDSAFLNSIQSLDSWKDTYNCYSLNPLVYNDQVNVDFFNSHADQFRSTWLKLALDHPDVLLRHQICVTSMIWRPIPSAGQYLFRYQQEGIVTNSLSLKSDSKWPQLQNWLISFANLTKLIWWPPPYLYATIAVVIVAAVRLRNANVLMLLLPSVFNSLVLLALIGVQDFRFQYPVIVIGLVTPALLLVHVDFDNRAELRPLRRIVP